MRLLLLFIGLAALVLVTFFIWGDSFMTIFSQEGAVQWLTKYGGWAWAAGILLLMADILLPLPGTLIMSALGFIYGTFAGGAISAAGSFLAGSFGYWLCRMMGENAALRLLGKKDFERGKKMSEKIGGWVVALSRWLPVFPEVIACMAGLTRMDPVKFHLALLCGSIPMGFTYAFIGNTGNVNATLAILLSAGIPPLIWFVIGKILHSELKQGKRPNIS